MAVEYSNVAVQNILSNQPVVFTENPVSGGRGFIFHRDGSGSFLLASAAPFNPWNGGCCGRNFLETVYEVAFHANIGIPAGGTVEEIQVAIVVDGEIDPSSIMRFTPAAVNEYGNIGTGIFVSVPNICRCSNVSVRNISAQAIEMQNANLIIAPVGVQRVNR